MASNSRSTTKFRGRHWNPSLLKRLRGLSTDTLLVEFFFFEVVNFSRFFFLFSWNCNVKQNYSFFIFLLVMILLSIYNIFLVPDLDPQFPRLATYAVNLGCGDVSGAATHFLSLEGFRLWGAEHHKGITHGRSILNGLSLSGLTPDCSKYLNTHSLHC